MNKTYFEVKRMKKTLAILLAAILMILACAASVYADDEESNEAYKNEAGEGDSGDGEKENSVPGFEFAFAAGAAIAAARLIKARLA
jgi:Spy/CpxP family protein refolding chaperone